MKENNLEKTLLGYLVFNEVKIDLEDLELILSLLESNRLIGIDLIEACCDRFGFSKNELYQKIQNYNLNLYEFAASTNKAKLYFELGCDVKPEDECALNFLREILQPITLQQWSDFSGVSIAELEVILDEYSIPTIPYNNTFKIHRLKSNKVPDQAINSKIANDLLSKWKNRDK